MMKYLLLTALLPFIGPDLKGTYSRQRKFPDKDRGLVVLWNLQLKDDASYNMTINYFGGGDITMGRVQKYGTWCLDHDTLCLTNDNPYVLYNYRFLVEGNKLIAIQKDEIHKLWYNRDYSPIDTLILK